MTDLAKLHADMIAMQAKRAEWVNAHAEGSREWSPMDAHVDAAVRAYSTAQRAAAETQFAGEWTAEVIAERRAAWNAWIVSQGSKVAWTAVVAREKAQGWTLADLKRAIAG